MISILVTKKQFQDLSPQGRLSSGVALMAGQETGSTKTENSHTHSLVDFALGWRQCWTCHAGQNSDLLWWINICFISGEGAVVSLSSTESNHFSLWFSHVWSGNSRPAVEPSETLSPSPAQLLPSLLQQKPMHLPECDVTVTQYFQKI